ncbi:hypothetical protein LCGC14_2473630, partial [marine sediment metagenome]
MANFTEEQDKRKPEPFQAPVTDNPTVKKKKTAADIWGGKPHQGWKDYEAEQISKGKIPVPHGGPISDDMRKQGEYKIPEALRRRAMLDSAYNYDGLSEQEWQDQQIADKFQDEKPFGAIEQDAYGNWWHGGQSNMEEWDLQAQHYLEERGNDYITAKEAMEDKWDSPEFQEQSGIVKAWDKTWDQVDLAKQKIGDFLQQGLYEKRKPLVVSQKAAEEAGRFGVALGRVLYERFIYGEKITERTDADRLAFEAHQAPRTYHLGSATIAPEAFKLSNYDGAWAEAKTFSEVLYGNIRDNTVALYAPDALNYEESPDMHTAEYMRIMEENPGMNPYRLARDYDDPRGELIGRAIINGEWLVQMGAGMAWKGVRTYRAVRYITKIMPGASEGVEAISTAKRLGGMGDDVLAAAKKEKLIVGIMSDNNTIRLGITLKAKSSK